MVRPRRQDRSFNRKRPQPAAQAEAARHTAGNDAYVNPAKPVFQSRQVRRLLEGIGTPPSSPFAPDQFQLEALAKVETEDVLVTAPTGSGKTWIAREEIRRLLAAGRRAWYTSPLKALTNSKYQEFKDEFGAEAVGILTGDRKENADAPLIVGTTEVYRNQLFDSLRSGRGVEADLVVMDEAHYLADEERGHVWEEAIILTPPRVRLLLLSATVGNAGEFAEWIAEVRGHRCSVVARRDEQGARPVPLRAAFLYPEGQLAPLFDEAKRFNAEITQYLQSRNARRGAPTWSSQHAQGEMKARLPEMPPSLLLTTLGSYDLLPAIVFLPTRRRCDEAAAEAALTGQGASKRGKKVDDERREARRARLREFAADHPEIKKHRHWEMLVRGGVASHHAGHLPAWKLAVERLMSAGLLDAIFATATVAAGVDYPARTVVTTGVEVRTGHGWRQLSVSEFQQMTGRAGRRGRDLVGFVVAAPGPHQNPQRVANLLQSLPEPLESQFRATYTTLLNLLDAYGSFAHVREIAERSFANREAVEQITRLERQRDEHEKRIGERLKQAGCVASVGDARGLERLASARSRLLEDRPHTRGEARLRWLHKMVVPGRVVSIGRGGRLVLVTERRESSLVGVREDGRRASIVLDRVNRVYPNIYSLSAIGCEAAFEDVRSHRQTALDEPRLSEARAPVDEAVELINKLIGQVTAGVEGEEGTNCAEALWSVIGSAEKAARAEQSIEALRTEVWQPFAERARVLAHFGYLDLTIERVTERGRWLADLRLDKPLLAGEALARNLFDSLTATSAAALVAALAADAERSYGELPLDDEVVAALAKFEQIADDVATVEWEQNLEPTPEINYSAAAAAARWAAGEKWETLVRETGAEEGDLFRMLSRTGESLMQISQLHSAHPAAARTASSAAERILREPVRSDEMI